MKTTKSIENSGFYKFELGSLELLIATDGYATISPIQPLFAPGIEPEKISKLLTKHYLPTDKLNLSGNVLLIKAGDRIILIDSGSGSLLGPKGKLTKSLLAADITPENITDIVITHAHPDHVGGLVNQDGSFVFSSANIYMAKAEYDFWMSDNFDYSKVNMKDIVDFNVAFAKQSINAVQSRLHFFNDKDILFNTLRADLAPGHTGGHMILTVFSEGEELIHTADTFHHIIFLDQPEWGNEVDSDFSLAVTTRKKVLAELATERKLVFADHLPWPGLGYIKKNTEGYEWTPKAIYEL